jgi:hypothetical protein
MSAEALRRATMWCIDRSSVQAHLQQLPAPIDHRSAGHRPGQRDASNGWTHEDFQEEHGIMEHTRPMGSLIGFDADAVSSRSAVNRGRRATDRAEAFAEVYDLAAYANSGSRSAARVSEPQGAGASPSTSGGLSTSDRAAADRLYMHLTTGGTWLRVSEEANGRVIMRLHDAAGAPVRELSITELAGDDGPEVA